VRHGVPPQGGAGRPSARLAPQLGFTSAGPRSAHVERSFAWAARFRRLARDYERLPQTVAGLHFVAFVTLMLAKATALFDLVRNTL
jgi:hypothetical protein